MFNVGGTEFLVIIVVALIFVGPEQLPGLLRRIGEIVGQARSMSSALRTEFMSGLDQVNDEVDKVRNAADPFRWGDGSPSTPIVPKGYAETRAENIRKAEAAEAAAADTAVGETAAPDDASSESGEEA